MHLHGTDARDWIRGTRPWNQFLNLCDRLGRQQGTELWAAYLSDPRLDAQFRKQLAERDPDAAPRPALAGYDRLAEGLLDIRRELAILIGVMGNSATYPKPAGPIFPAERFRLADQHAEANKLDAAVAAGIQRGKDQHIA